MPSSELQKKAIYFLIFVVFLALLLIFFPAIEDSIRTFMSARFGLVIDEKWSISMPDGGRPETMIETSVNLASNILRILQILIWMALVVAIVRFVFFLFRQTVSRNAAEGEASSLLKTVLSIVIYIVAFFIIFQTQFPDVQLGPLFTGSTIIGIVVGLALQDTLGNLFAGLALQADQSFQVGDVISIGSLGNGVVESVSWRGVKIRTFQNKLLVISNAAMGKEAIEVAPKTGLNARLIFFTTLYSASPANTAIHVREAIRLSENVSQKLRPIVRIKALGTDGIDWEVKYWLNDYSKYNDSDALIRQRIWYVCQREKIGFAFPTRTVHIEPQSGETGADEIVNTIAEHLNRVSVFTPLSDEEIERLAKASISRIYAPGEAIVRMGQKGSSMFVVTRGSVKVQIPENDYQKTLVTLSQNDFFGERSLLTGEPRSANVIAIEETEVLRIDKNALKPILENNPNLVESISELIEERKVVINKGEDKPTDRNTSKKGAIRSIRKFFGLQ